MNPHYLTPWGDIIRVADEYHPALAPKPLVKNDKCAVCAQTLQIMFVGGNQIKVCPLHGTRGTTK